MGHISKKCLIEQIKKIDCDVFEIELEMKEGDIYISLIIQTSLLV